MEESLNIKITVQKYSSFLIQWIIDRLNTLVISAKCKYSNISLTYCILRKEKYDVLENTRLNVINLAASCV